MDNPKSTYAASDHKAMLADSILEINELSNLVKDLRSDISLIQQDIDILNKSLHDFGKHINDVKIKASDHLANVAIAAFDDQLQKVERMIGRILREEKPPERMKKRWFWQR